MGRVVGHQDQGGVRPTRRARAGARRPRCRSSRRGCLSARRRRSGSGLFMSARARATRCLSPPGKLGREVVAPVAEPDVGQKSARPRPRAPCRRLPGCAWRGARLRRRRARERGRRTGRPCRGRRRGAPRRCPPSPPRSTVPASGASRPARRFRSVDFPEPDSPRMLTLSPAATSRSTPRSTSRRRLPARVAFPQPAGAEDRLTHCEAPPRA